MALTKITQADVNDKGVIGLPDTPNLSTQAMQEKFDELALDVIVPKHNELVDDLEAGTAAASIGAMKNGEATTVQDILDDMSVAGYTKAETDVLLSGKVDKEEGKVLSTNDFTDGFRLKLNGIEDNANNYVLPPATQDTLGGVMGDGTTFTVDENGVGHAVGGGGGGTADYEALINKPKLNDLALIGDKQSEDYGILRPYIKVTSDAGSTVTIKKGAEEITLTQVSGSTTEWEGHPTAYGTWTVKSVLAGADDATTTVTVDAVKTYAVTVNHISATITVTYPNGADCKLSKGALEYTATQNPQTFTVRSVGTWTVTCTYNGIVKTATAIISADGDSQSVTIEYATLTVNYGNDFKGKTITCTDGDLTYTKVAPNDSSSISFTIPSTGTWTVSATVGGTPYSVSQVVSSYTTYTVTLEVFSATVTITFPYSNGATCTISDGDTTLTATESPMAFTIPNTGTWVATCTLDGQSKTQSFVITTDGQTESHTFEYGTINLTFANEFRGLTLTCSSGGTTISKVAPSTGNTMAFYPPSTGTWDISGIYNGVTYTTSATVSSLSTAVSAVLQTIPDGSTVTPINNVQKLLNCAGIFNKNYTAISQLLADSTSLLTVISDNNAVNYLVRSTGFATDMCANSTAMTDIGANDYCAETLLDDSTWRTAICNSTYFESVLNVKVPTMTSDTAPSGTVTANNYTSGYEPYRVFSSNPISTQGWSAMVETNGWVAYEATFSMCINKVDVVPWTGADGAGVKNFKIQGYDSDSGTWEDIYSDTVPNASSPSHNYYNFANNKSYSKHRLYILNSYRPVGGNIILNKLQFYGR